MLRTGDLQGFRNCTILGKRGQTLFEAVLQPNEQSVKRQEYTVTTNTVSHESQQNV